MNRMERSKRNVLVIKHGALGDFVLATGPMSAIRSHHEGDHIVLLTTKLFEAFAAQSYFCLLYTSPSPRDVEESRMPSSA